MGRTTDGNEGGEGSECGGPAPVVYYSFNECAMGSPEGMGTGLELDLVSADCVGPNEMSSALGTAWGSGTSLACSALPAQCASAADDPRFEPEELTISVWVFSTDWLDCGDDPGLLPETCTIVSKGNSDELSNGYWLSVDPDPWAEDPESSAVEVRLVVAAGGPDTEYEVRGGEPTDDTWHHVVATFDGTTAAIYLDGAPVGRVDTGGISYGDEEFLVGAMTDRGYSHNGLVDELKLWHYAMDADEVADLYEVYSDC